MNYLCSCEISYHKCPPKEPICISVVSKELKGRWNGPCTLSPAISKISKILEFMGASTIYIVTFFGSPPNAAMFFWTQSRANRSRWSWKSKQVLFIFSELQSTYSLGGQYFQDPQPWLPYPAKTRKLCRSKVNHWILFPRMDLTNHWVDSSLTHRPPARPVQLTEPQLYRLGLKHCRQSENHLSSGEFIVRHWYNPTCHRKSTNERFSRSQ